VVEKAVEYGKEGILNGFDFWGLGNIAQGSKVLGSISSTQKKKKTCDREELTGHWCSFFFGSAGIWTQGLHLKPHHQLFFVLGFYMIGSCLANCLFWLALSLDLLISASCIARITGASH
jgi:hypothetical protein